MQKIIMLQWELIGTLNLKLTYSLERESAKNFINSEQCQKNHVGDLNVKSAKVTKLIEIPYDDPSIYSTTWEQERR